MPDAIGDDTNFAQDITEATFTNIPRTDFIEEQGTNAVTMLGGQV